MPDRQPDPTPPLEEALRGLIREIVRDELALAAGADVPDRALDLVAAAAALGISRRRLYGELAAKRIRSIHAGRRHLVPASAIAEYLAGGSS